MFTVTWAFLLEQEKRLFAGFETYFAEYLLFGTRFHEHGSSEIAIFRLEVAYKKLGTAVGAFVDGLKILNTVRTKKIFYNGFCLVAAVRVILIM